MLHRVHGLTFDLFCPCPTSRGADLGLTPRHVGLGITLTILCTNLLYTTADLVWDILDLFYTTLDLPDITPDLTSYTIPDLLYITSDLLYTLPDLLLYTTQDFP